MITNSAESLMLSAFLLPTAIGGYSRGGSRVKSNMVYNSVRTWYTHLES